MRKIVVNLGWDKIPNQKFAADCDLAAFLLVNKKLNKEKDVVYFANPVHESHAVEHFGDNLSGENAHSENDETIALDLSALSEKCPQHTQVIFTVSIYAGKERGQTFGKIPNAFFRVRDQETGEDLCRLELTRVLSGEIAAKVGRFRKEDGEWTFQNEAVPLFTEGGKISQIASALKEFKKTIKT